ncbi:MAG: GTP cyclohydrolase II [Chrysothrix sp. TS-e1954]|nr:MAG: GTP cyclohydrolase II [Chrysothrix sp. TS-e1954]
MSTTCLASSCRAEEEVAVILKSNDDPQTYTAMPSLPSHASPALRPVTPPRQTIHHTDNQLNDDPEPSDPPPGLISPSFTPPSTPGSSTPAPERDAPSVSLDPSTPLSTPRLLEALPEVDCQVRARIPTVTGQEMFLHLYQNSIDNKEHLAIVFGETIRSRSLDRPKPGETEHDRLTRGAYVGRLYPGRTESGFGVGASGKVASKQSCYKPEAPNQISTTSRVPLTENRPSSSQSHNMNDASSQITSSHPARSPKPQHTDPLVRIHSECYTGETVWSARCDCGEQLDEAARLMSLPQSQASGGVIIYLRQEGRGIGLGEKLKAYNLQDLGNDTVQANLLLRHPADARSYGLATAMLLDLGLGRDNEGVNGKMREDGGRGIRLLTNNPDKIRAVEGPDREVIVKERVAMVPLAWKGAKGIDSTELGGYMKTKIERMGHMLNME